LGKILKDPIKYFGDNFDLSSLYDDNGLINMDLLVSRALEVEQRNLGMQYAWSALGESSMRQLEIAQERRAEMAGASGNVLTNTETKTTKHSMLFGAIKWETTSEIIPEILQEAFPGLEALGSRESSLPYILGWANPYGTAFKPEYATTFTSPSGETRHNLTPEDAQEVGYDTTQGWSVENYEAIQWLLNSADGDKFFKTLSGDDYEYDQRALINTVVTEALTWASTQYDKTYKNAGEAVLDYLNNGHLPYALEQ